MIEIEDNFLGQNELDRLQNILMGDMFPWYYNSMIDFREDKGKYQFIHIFYDNSAPTTTNAEMINPILTKLGPILLCRIKANLLTRTSNIIENEFHVDMASTTVNDIDSDEHQRVLKQLTTSIFYVNTNNGYTKFEDGTKIESVANRLIKFPANMKHKGTSCTDEKIRIVINFNYFKLF